MKAFAAILVALLVLAGAQQASAVYIYNNSTSDQTNRLSAADNTWFGDEILLGTTYSDRFMVHFDFQYWATNTSGLTIDIQLAYNDGAPFNGVPSPGTVVYSYSGFALGDTPRSTINIDIADLDLFDTVSDGGTLLTAESLTLALNFHFNGGGGEAGVDLYNPPSEGTAYDDYWLYNGSNWQLVTNNTFSVVNFGMRIEAIPEPSTFALFVLGGLMTFWSRRFWSRK